MEDFFEERVKNSTDHYVRPANEKPILMYRAVSRGGSQGQR
jgi:hypothetical protein